MSGRPPQLNEPLQMVIGVSKQVVDHDDPLGEVRQRPLPSHRDPAMHLNGFLGDQTARTSDEVFGRRNIVAIRTEME